MAFKGQKKGMKSAYGTNVHLMYVSIICGHKKHRFMPRNGDLSVITLCSPPQKYFY